MLCERGSKWRQKVGQDLSSILTSYRVEITPTAGIN